MSPEIPVEKPFSCENHTNHMVNDIFEHCAFDKCIAFNVNTARIKMCGEKVEKRHSSVKIAKGRHLVCFLF